MPVRTQYFKKRLESDGRPERRRAIGLFEHGLRRSRPKLRHAARQARHRVAASGERKAVDRIAVAADAQPLRRGEGVEERASVLALVGREGEEIAGPVAVQVALGRRLDRPGASAGESELEIVAFAFAQAI